MQLMGTAPDSSSSQGHNFTIASLLEDAEQAKQYENGEIAVFRLAPADYHRYHSPVAGTVGKSKSIEGCYYVRLSTACDWLAPHGADCQHTSIDAAQTVNPVCVNENLDVFTKNKRDGMSLKFLTALSWRPCHYVAQPDDPSHWRCSHRARVSTSGRLDDPGRVRTGRRHARRHHCQDASGRRASQARRRARLLRCA